VEEDNGVGVISSPGAVLVVSVSVITFLPAAWMHFVRGDHDPVAGCGRMGSRRQSLRYFLKLRARDCATLTRHPLFDWTTAHRGYSR
jgi:hypothetical protein